MKYVACTVYLSFFASLWYEFAKGPNVYLDRFIAIMTPAYFLSACLLWFVVLCLGIAIYALEKDKTFKKKLDAIPIDSWNKMVRQDKSIFNRAYVYICFYPTILCAGILLGKYWLFAFMFADMLAGRAIRSQMKVIQAELTRDTN